MSENLCSDWQPIETAPKDGTWVLAHGDGDGWEGCTFVCEFAEDLGGYSGWQEVPGDKMASPTHWMPLPAPPNSEPDGSTPKASLRDQLRVAREAMREVDKWMLVIESAVRADAPRDHRAVLDALKANSAAPSLLPKEGEK